MTKTVFAAACMLCAGALFAQDEATNDAVIIRAILDSNGMQSLSLDSIAEFSSGKAITLNLNNPEIGKKGISVLPPAIGSLTELTTLTLNDNDLTELPVQIGHLKKLKRLEVQNNSLVSLPGAIGNLASLEEVDLRNNQLSSLPIEIAICSHLWKMQLWGNKLRTLPETIGSMSALRELYLRGNRLETLPNSVLRLKLSYLDMQDNRLCQVSGSVNVWLKKFDDRYHSWQKCF